ncbi:vacuolar protein sorting-associated protein 13 [Mycena maculata]|uniref:Vacuolar protein sorting-associated protein 13 n=1 Tax=Mycena maculata TaxID=230809 RepID=A0AAD7P1E3_9AGAR|nr:vacuolar protein sorting-associated protein 13 [Mycena maculata]
MWWLDPGKEVLNVLFNRILAPYVENLDMNQVNYGIGQGQLTLRNLRLKKGALDKFRLPVDVLEGHLGKFTLSLHWMNLGNQPVEVMVEDVYLLVVPSPQSNDDPEEEEKRAQAAKAERLENAELLHMRGQAESTDDTPQSQGLLESLTAKIVNNLQVTVKNIHIRYEDKLSVPGHPFAAGVTLAGFTAVSVNDHWQAAFIESTAGAIHKLANLQSLAVYFDTDSPSMAGLSPAEANKRFTALISTSTQDTSHQFILKPVSGEGRVTMNHKFNNETPHFDVQLLFDEIGVALDDKQYRDIISLGDMYHVYIRQHQYRKFRPPDAEFAENPAKYRLRYAGTAILEGVRDRRRKWTWTYFAERRDDRNKYVNLFQKKTLNTLAGPDLKVFEALEKKLSYEDIRFYRSIARSRLRKDVALRKKLEQDKSKGQPAKQGWGSWLWGSTPNANQEDSAFGGTMTEEQRKQLYDVLDYDEKAAVAESLSAPREALKARIAAKLNKGSFALKTHPHGEPAQDILSIVFDVFQANVIQRLDNLEAEVSLGGFGVFDGTTKNSLYPQIVQVKDLGAEAGDPSIQVEGVQPVQEPFFFVKFEHNPLDERADNALTVRMRHMSIIYHKGYIEEVYKFFRPASQLESVDALLSVASETLEGLRKETRAGLEYALQTHKTVDIQMDMNAPVIIIPEDVTTHNCKHLIIDAGHIAIESDLADKDAIRAIQQKRNKQYSDQDYKELESLMYDKLSIRLEAAQFVLGNDLKSCQDALTSDAKDSLHLLERINLDLQVQNSIVPTAFTLARFKVAGKLPSLQVNLSDTKYKALMRLIDVCIPKFGDDAGEPSAPPPLANHVSSAFQRPSGLFTQSGTEYNVDDDDDDADDASTGGDEKFFEADDGSVQRPELHQHIFELNFQVDNLRASLAKTGSDGAEKPMGDVTFQRFALLFALKKFDMKVDVNLRSLSMILVQPNADPIKFVSSPESDLSEDKDLLSLTYTRVQKESPEFVTVYEEIDQSVDIKISTFIFRAAPEPVLALYDFVMTTFVPQSNPAMIESAEESPIGARPEPVEESASGGKIRVLVKLASVQVMLIHGIEGIATLSLSTADVSVLVLPKTLQVTGRLGSLAFINDSSAHPVRDEFNQILSIEGQNFASFRYQTFDPDADTYTGIKSSVSLNAASVKFYFLEEPLHEIFLFLTKLAKLKGLYDAATQVAVQRASEIERMQFDVSVKSPIVVFPSDPSRSRDVLVLRLGEITAKNSYEAVVNKTTASLTGIQLLSNLYADNDLSTLKIVDDIDVNADVVQTSNIDRNKDGEYPDTQISIKISDVRLHLTQVQYVLLMRLSQSIPRIFSGAPDAPAAVQPAPSTKSVSQAVDAGPHVDLQPELRMTASANGNRPWTTMDLVVVVNAIKLHLYDALATNDSNLKEHGIARFALNNNTLRLKMLSDGAGEAQIVLKSFTIGNTRPGLSKFREIIPAAQHDRNQFMVLYTMSGGVHPSALAILTVDSPQVIFAVDPVIALLRFFTSAFTGTPAGPLNEEMAPEPQEIAESQSQTTVDFRVDLHDVSISVLENDADAESPAMKLTINQVLLSQQGIMALTVNRLGMSLIRMGQPSESVRFLDDVDLTFSLDSRSSSGQQMTSMEISAKPIVFRASYRDINMIMSIVNKAIELYSDSQDQGSPEDNVEAQSMRPSQTQITKASASKQPVGKARVLMSKELLKGSFDGFRLVLIGDMHEQPMLHLKVKPFIIGAKDWSAELQATTTMATQISYWNLANSHWEPLIDPWTLTTSVSKTQSNGMSLTLSSRERLDLNLTTTFAELATNTLNMWAKQGKYVLQKARGSYAPYRISNRTGSSIFIWPDVDGSSSAKDVAAVKIPNDETVDWRFDDWKTMREHVPSSGQHNVGVQFDGKPWEQLRSIPVDREGEFIFTLRPRTEKYPNRLLVEVTVVDTVKVVTLRSTYKVENLTLYPLEVTLVDDIGHPIQSLEKVAPGEHYSLPIEAVTSNKIRIQPDQGFGYKWCPALRWEELIAKKSFTIKCPHTDPREAAFRFQAWVQTNVDDANTRKYPKINLKLRAPVELENLLPYNLEYRIYDKDTDQNWRSYLRQGGVMPVHSVELSHLVLLNVEVQDTVFKPSDFAIINTNQHSDFDIENRLSLRDSNDRKLDLKLNYVRYPESGGAFKVQIYSPYLIVNKMGLPFGARSRSRTGSPQDVAGDTRSDIQAQPLPFMLSHPSEKGHEFIFRVGESTWSKVFSFEAPSAETELVVASQKQRTDEIHIGVSWSEGLGKYKLTKVITLAPRFLIKNNLSEAISFREHGVAPRDRSIIKPGERCPLHFLRAGQERLLTVAFSGLNAQWSPPIKIEDIGSVHLRLRRPGREQDPVQLIRGDVKIDGSTIFISFSPAKEGWPFMIENDSDYTATICQKDSGSEEEGSSNKTNVTYTVDSRSSLPYAWDFPAASDKKILLSFNGFRRVIDVMEIGDLVPFRFNDNQRNRVVSLDVRADGHKQVLRITNYNPELSLYKPKRANSVPPTRQDTISGNAEAFDAITEEVPPSLAFTVDFAGIGISLVNKKLVEVIYVSMNELKFEYTNSAVAQAVNLSCGVLQIDNQLHDALYPVILQPTPIPKESNGTAALPTVQASVIWLKDQEHGVLFVKYCSVLLQALTIEADEDLLFSIYDLTQIKGASWEEGVADVLIQNEGEILEPKDTAVGEDLYFEVLELQPIKLSLSFMRTERVSAEEKLSIRNPLAVVINAITMAVGNINDAPLEMNALAIKDMRLTMPELQTRIAYHYRQDVLRQLYRILGSADFIGNPVGLFTNVSSGVADIFYEPFNGVVMHGNKELGIGIAKGAASFVKKTVFGVSDSMTKFTSSVGKGLSAATFDSEYQTRRRLNQRRNKPRHAIYGVTAGGEALASSVASAMEGVLMKPIEGAESEGAFGFFKGVGKGLVGSAVTKPVVGVFDLASNVTEGIRNTTTVFDGPARDRVRLPRHVSADGVLRPYDARAATGQYWLRDLDNGTYRQEAYVAHINAPGGDNVVLLTSSRVLSFWSKKLKLDWELPFSQVQGVTVEDTGIRFAHKAGKEHDKFVFIQDKSSQSWFFGQVATVVKAFNSRKRQDV